ncbi:MAG: hypothetical protein CVU09_04970 [Bacteroidetes bacterium HGW-Bacteroidetes-4]|nr:MAG: hypothetical protein CVU09_04970 [Bacteroidetes bacterium HGW-Bacteroidetes-4]
MYYYLSGLSKTECLRFSLSAFCFFDVVKYLIWPCFFCFPDHQNYIVEHVKSVLTNPMFRILV